MGTALCVASLRRCAQVCCGIVVDFVRRRSFAAHSLLMVESPPVRYGTACTARVGLHDDDDDDDAHDAHAEHVLKSGRVSANVLLPLPPPLIRRRRVHTTQERRRLTAAVCNIPPTAGGAARGLERPTASSCAGRVHAARTTSSDALLGAPIPARPADATQASRPP